MADYLEGVESYPVRAPVAPDARAARGLPRRHPGQRLQRHPVRAPEYPGTGDRLARQRVRPWRGVPEVARQAPGGSDPASGRFS